MEKQEKLLKLAAGHLEDLLQRNETLEVEVKHDTLVEKVAKLLLDQGIVTTLDTYLEKVSELNEKSVEELERLSEFITTYAPRVKAEFGKLAESGLKEMFSSLSAEDQFKIGLTKE